MILGNEGKIIERCLKSVLGVADFISLCVNGTDDTYDKAQKFLQNNSERITGRVYRTSWVDFEVSRTESFVKGLETAAVLEIPRQNVYFLLLDGDHELVNKGFSKSELTDEAYQLNQYEPGIQYPNTRLIPASMNWHAVTATHEYWEPVKDELHREIQWGFLDTLHIIDHNDGGSRSNKYERDEKLLLERELVKNPKSDRAHFYLAQTYYYWGKLDKAEEYYKKRLDLGGYVEEIWYSLYQLGRITHKLNRWPEAMNYLMEAISKDPHRAEPYYVLAEKYRMDGKHTLAYDFAERGYRVPLPKKGLFVDPGPYEWGFLYNIALTGFYVDRDRGLRASSLFIMHPKAPWDLKKAVREALKCYITDPPTTLGFNWLTVSVQLPQNYLPMNPSMFGTSDGLLVNCRSVNYYMKNQQWYVLQPDGYVRTRNFLTRYNWDLEPLKQNEIIAPPAKVKPKKPIAGLEDCRIFNWRGSIWVICSSWEYHTPPCADGPQQCLGELEFDSSVWKFKRFIALKSPQNRTCEKNWLPLVHCGELYLIYESNTLLKPNLETGECTTVYQHQGLLDFSSLRGSAAPIPYPIRGEPGYLYVVHEVLEREKAGRLYLHRFVWLNNRLEIAKISVPFLLREQGIEYIAGISMNPNRKDLYIGVGIADREAYIVQTTTEKINSFLQDVSQRI